jgi:hypothetical protein
MPDVAARQIGPTLLTAAAATIATVPVNTTWILRNIHVANGSANSIAVNLSIGTFAAGTAFYNSVWLPGNGSLDWSGFMVVNASEIIQAFASTASVLALTIAGVTRTP